MHSWFSTRSRVAGGGLAVLAALAAGAATMPADPDVRPVVLTVYSDYV